jgi:hypothetical protein
MRFPLLRVMLEGCFGITVSLATWVLASMWRRLRGGPHPAPLRGEAQRRPAFLPRTRGQK